MAKTNRTTTTNREPECWYSRYQLQNLALEIERNTSGIITQAEALERAKGLVAEGKVRL